MGVATAGRWFTPRTQKIMNNSEPRTILYHVGDQTFDTMMQATNAAADQILSELKCESEMRFPYDLHLSRDTWSLTPDIAGTVEIAGGVYGETLSRERVWSYRAASRVIRISNPADPDWAIFVPVQWDRNKLAQWHFGKDLACSEKGDLATFKYNKELNDFIWRSEESSKPMEFYLEDLTARWLSATSERLRNEAAAALVVEMDLGVIPEVWHHILTLPEGLLERYSDMTLLREQIDSTLEARENRLMTVEEY